MMMMFGNGITGLDTMLGMLGIAVHSSSATAWAEIANHLGIAQQKVADVCQEQNLENEKKEMQELGITPIMHDGHLCCHLPFHRTWGGRSN